MPFADIDTVSMLTWSGLEKWSFKNTIMMLMMLVMLVVHNMVQVHANTAHAEHAAVGEEARKMLRDELENEYILYHYIR